MVTPRQPKAGKFGDSNAVNATLVFVDGTRRFGEFSESPKRKNERADKDADGGIRGER